MKAIVINGEFIRTEPDNAVTDPDSTYTWVDVDAPPVLASEVAVAGVTIDEVQRTVTRTWSVRPKTADELRITWERREWLERFTEVELGHLRDQRFALLVSALCADRLSNDSQPVLDLLDALVADGAITNNRRTELLA